MLPRKQFVQHRCRQLSPQAHYNLSTPIEKQITGIGRVGTPLPSSGRLDTLQHAMCEATGNASYPYTTRNLFVRLGPAMVARSMPPVLLLAACLLGGCQTWSSNRWLGDYDVAERQSAKRERPLLIYFEEDRPNHDSQLASSIKSERFRFVQDDFVCCSLVRSIERDRRYVAQYGVDRAPAIIVVHRDGTYHATAERSMSADELVAFLDSAVSPGTPIDRNRYVPHKPHFDWYSSLDEGERVAQRTGRPMLVLFHRSMSRDRWRIEGLLSRHEVYLRLKDLVHVRIGLFQLFEKAYITKYGVLRIPAIVIAQPDGTFDVLELPPSCEAVIDFVDKALRPRVPAEPAEPTVATTTP